MISFLISLLMRFQVFLWNVISISLFIMELETPQLNFFLLSINTTVCLLCVQPLKSKPVSFHRHSLRPFHPVQHSEPQVLKKIVKTCLLNLVTPFLTLMLTLLKDLSISTNGLAILMPFFLAILLTTPQVSST